MKKLNQFFFGVDRISLGDWLLFYGLFIFSSAVSLISWVVTH